MKIDQMKLLRLGGRRMVLARTEHGYVAFDDRCTHKGGSLAGGVMVCGTVQCLWHGSQFDASNGKVKAGPAEKPICVYRVSEEAGQVKLVL
jgi:nitrite reductase/ring-hydroxylating ferredoxin subunit